MSDNPPLFRSQYEQSLLAGLMALRNIQRCVSSNYPDAVVNEGERPTPDQVRTYAFALSKEASELADELGWKPWKFEQPLDIEKILGEFADVTAFYSLFLHFIMCATGATYEQVAEAYIQKSETNIRRANGQVAGYGYSLKTDLGVE